MSISPIDHTDRLPDALLLSILSLLSDVKSLGRCSAVSRRFHSLVPLVPNILVRIDCVLPDDHPLPSPKPSRSVLSHLSRLLLKPLHALLYIPPCLSSKTTASSLPETASHHSPTEVLRNFREIKHLKIDLPAGELGVDDGAFLKWKANFGSTLQSCVILGASLNNSVPDYTPVCVDDGGIIPEDFYANGNLRVRVLWTVSALIAASARHFLLRTIVAEHETLESLELGDADGQGVLWMDGRQLRELRTKPVPASGNSQRTLVPALSMRLWYASRLELPGGVLLKGATLLAIRPKDELGKEVVAGGAVDGVAAFESCCMLNNFEEPYRTAVKMLVKRRSYTLEMNSF